MHTFYPCVVAVLLSQPAALLPTELNVVAVRGSVADANPEASYWKSAQPLVVTMTAQPMTTPRPATTTTPNVTVQGVHDGTWLALRLTWTDPEPSYAGKLGEFSDAVAVQFPIKAGPPPPIWMGAKESPVHIYHWRAQYQRDRLEGKPGMRDLYPHMTVDMYPMEYADPGHLGQFAESDRDRFSPGRVAGNPQSYSKTGVDEIYAEGFSTSSVQEGHGSVGDGCHQAKTWTVVLVRRMNAEGGSVITPGQKAWMGVAVWQGGQGEVGSRKCVTMAWQALNVAPAVAP